MIKCAYDNTRLPFSLLILYSPFFLPFGDEGKGRWGENEGKGCGVGGANLFYLFFESESEKPTRTHHKVVDCT